MFLKPGSPLPCSQQPTNCPCPKPEQPTAILIFPFLNIYFNNILSYPNVPSVRICCTKTLYAFLFSYMRATWPAHHSGLDFIVPIIYTVDYKSWRLCLCNFGNTRLIMSFIHLTIFVSAYSSNTLTLLVHTYLNAEDQVSHSYQTQEVTVAYTFMLLHRTREDKDSASKDTRNSCNSIYPLLLHAGDSDLLVWLKNIWNSSHFPMMYYLSSCCDCHKNYVTKVLYFRGLI